MSVDLPPDRPVPEQPPVPPKKRRWLPTLGMGILVLLVLGAGGFVTASLLEEHDSFCIACHTAPESAYYDRAHLALDMGVATANVPDLASAHYTLSKEHNKPDFTCINCHRGDSSLANRMQTLALGGRDALIFVTGKGNPTLEKGKIAEGFLPDAACVSCHADTMLTVNGQANHFHNALPQTSKLIANGAQWIVPPDAQGNKDELLSEARTVETTVTCLSCHVAHKTIPNGSATTFTQEDVVKLECQKCHLDDPLSDQ
jgi:nitrate/TMAO reductase-like tetraheme cytochrome c subunit